MIMVDETIRQNEKGLEQPEEPTKDDWWHRRYAEDDTMLTIDQMCIGSAIE